MERPRMRPLFKLALPIAAPRLMAEIRARVQAPDSRFAGTVLKRHAQLTVCRAEQHFWSPHLSLDVFEEGGGERARVRGRYASHPSIWTFVMAVYGVLLMAGLGACVFGICQQLLGWTPWAYALLPVCALLVLLTWLVSAAGQRLATDQMHGLHAFVEDCVRRASEPPPPPPA